MPGTTVEDIDSSARSEHPQITSELEIVSGELTAKTHSWNSERKRLMERRKNLCRAAMEAGIPLTAIARIVGVSHQALRKQLDTD